MSNITGFDNEFEFVKYLNGKKINQLNPMFYDLIKYLFPFENEDTTIKSWRNHYKQKTDVFVKINGMIKGISIKKGMKNSFHTERITDFIHFLIENKVDKEIVIEYLKYQYADGSTNGKGNHRLSSDEYKEFKQSGIDKINKCFSDKKLLKKSIERFITKGKISNYYIDVIVCGEVDDFIWVSKKEVEKIIFSKKDSYSTAVHFGPLTCQPKCRCLNYNPIHEKDRYCVQLKWYNFFDDIIEYKNEELQQKNNVI